MNAEHVKIIKKGVEVWNGWRTENAVTPDLGGVDLRDADLGGANLRYANFGYANLGYANLGDTPLPPPSIMLLARWGRVSDKLCLELMKYDAANHPDPLSFNRWVEEGDCPYDNCRYQRSANFTENKDLWVPIKTKKVKSKSALELVEMLLKEKTKTDDSL